MEAMHNYLSALFKDENTVILPKLGALTVIDHATGELMFMPYLKHNDGTFINFIAKSEQISVEQAKEQVERYVENIQQVVASGKIFEISKIGRFRWDDTLKEIVFTSNVSTQNNAIAESVPQTEQKKQEKMLKEASSHSERVDISISSPQKEEHKPIAEAHTPPIKTKTQEKQKMSSVKKNDEKKTEAKQSKEAMSLQKRKRSVWMVVVLPILLMLFIGAGIYVGLYYDELKEKQPLSSKKYAQEKRQKTLESESSQTEIDRVNEEVKTAIPSQATAENIEEIQQTIQKEVRSIQTSNGLTIDKNMPIQVIIGSFEDEDNAQKLIRQLKAKGLHAETVGKLGYLHLVSAASFQSMNEYNKNRSQLSNFGNYWVKQK